MSTKFERVDLPLLPLRDIVVFPGMVAPLFVGRDRSVAAVEVALAADRRLLLAAQKDPQVAQPEPHEIFDVGTLATILQVVRLPDGMIKLLIEGGRRHRLREYLAVSPCFLVTAEPFVERRVTRPRATRAIGDMHEVFERYAQLAKKKVGRELQDAVGEASDPGELADLIANRLDLAIEDRQFLLEIPDPVLRLIEVQRLIQAEIDVLEVEQKIQQRVKEQMERNQREYFLNEQMKAIQNELGYAEDGKAEIEAIQAKLQADDLPAHVRERGEQELRKLRLMAPNSAEAAVVRNYLEWIVALPWNRHRDVFVDIDHVRQVLDQDHYGLDKVKERIVEFLAVRKLTDFRHGPKLCLVGPPGVGKTSLARSIAQALGLEFVRQSLGGVRDEAEIRGHRRTYIGALPGRIVQGLKKVETGNPVFLLDEVDKLANDFRGDPASALLEVLDPEQNDSFIDHYLDLELDLSRVFFVTTANGAHTMPKPLLDRLEVIELGSYTEAEKLEIAKRHLVPKQVARHGLEATQVRFQSDALAAVIREYTREAGVRELERKLEAVCRKLAVQLVEGNLSSDKRVRVTAKVVHKLLGPPRYKKPDRHSDAAVGVSNGLAWTEAGGHVLLTEVAVVPGQGRLEITGKLGDVMQESVRAAMSYVRSRAVDLGIDPQFYQDVDVHVHVPEGAVPKDGPSAGITVATALISALTGVPVRGDVAMTGEITLRGRVLAIGGLKEKLLAAHRSGFSTVLIPSEVERDLVEVPELVRAEMQVILVETMDQVLEAALASEDPEGVFAFLTRRGIHHPAPPPPPTPAH